MPCKKQHTLTQKANNIENPISSKIIKSLHQRTEKQIENWKVIGASDLEFK